MCRQHPHVGLDPELLERVDRGLHLLAIVRRTHQHGHLHRDYSSSRCRSSDVVAILHARKRDLPNAVVGRASRAAAIVGPKPTTSSTRPPAVTSRPSTLARRHRRRTPAMSSSSASASMPSMGAPVRGASGYPGDATTTHTAASSTNVGVVVDELRRRPRTPAARTRSDDSRGSTTCASGSPKRTLYSSELRAFGREHQARVQRSSIVDAVAGAACAASAR